MASGIITGMEGYARKLDKLKTSDPELAKMLQDAIRQALKTVRNELSKNAKTGLQMESDPRQAVRAIRHSVYRRIFGGNVNILQGGNRKKITSEDLGKRQYFGAERGYVLRFLNQGTRERVVGFRNNKANAARYEEYLKSGNRGGRRGHIDARNWFGGASEAELKKMSETLDEYINRVIMKMMD
jgi:hypothetical protein